jgi:predicted nucleotidyltransferase component of viral defense system
MKIPELDNFYLVGGTALALMYGHRKSVDIDLFSTKPFENAEIIPVLENTFQNFSYRNSNNAIGLFCFIGNIKVDFVKHHIHPLIATPSNFDGIRLFHSREIIAMKVMAILKRGVKKDFWDLTELLNHYSIQNCIDAYTKKYPSQQLVISIPNALTYFEDAEESENPISLKGQTWESIKKSIQQKVNAFLK